MIGNDEDRDEGRVVSQGMMYSIVAHSTGTGSWCDHQPLGTAVKACDDRMD